MPIQTITVPEDADDLRAAIETYVPDIVVAARATLRAAWETNSLDETVVVDFGLSNEFLLPLATPRSFRGCVAGATESSTQTCASASRWHCKLSP